MSTIVRNKSIIALWVMMLAMACSKEPSKKVATGEDHNLYKKSDLENGILKTAELDGRMAYLAASLNTSSTPEVSFEISKSFLTMFSVNSEGAKTAIFQYDIDGHYDLVGEKNKNGETSHFLVKDEKTNPEWQKRAYIEMDPFSPKKIEATLETMKNLYLVEGLEKEYAIGKENIPGLAAKEVAGLMSRFALKKGDKISLKLTKTQMILFSYSAAGNPIILSETPVAYFDVLQTKNDSGEKTAEVAKNQVENDWFERKFVELNPDTAALQDSESKYLDKSIFAGKCFEESPMKEVADMLAQGGVVLEAGEEVCFDVSQSVLSVSKKKNGQMTLIMTLDVVEHADISFNGDGDSDVLGSDKYKQTWNKRKFVQIKTNNPKYAENKVQPNALEKNAFNGEFVYAATVVSAHSETGSFFEGQTFVGNDRVKFEFHRNEITGYKVSDLLNVSESKSPVLKYNAAYFDVERARNSFGDGTHIIVESDRKPWENRSNIRVDLASNQVASYLNDILGIQRLLGQSLKIGSSQLTGDVKIEKDYITWDTETVIYPVLSRGLNENGLDPMSVTIRHSLVNVANRGYEAKEYSEADFKKFGYFWTTQFGLDGDLRATDDTVKHFIGKHDTANGKKIKFYTDPNYPERYKEVTAEVMASWNQVMKKATGRTDDVITLEDNSGQAVGDPRYNMLVYSAARSTRAPAGYGPSIPDPKTGEFISSRSFIYGESLRYIRRVAGDYYDLVKEGKLPVDFENEAQSIASGLGNVSSEVGDLGGGFNTGLNVTFDATTVADLKEINAQQTSVPVDVVKAMDAASGNTSAQIAAILDSALTKEFKSVAGLENGMKDFDAYNQYLASRGQCIYGADEHIVSAVQFIIANIDKDRDQLMEELEMLSYYNILLHEVGHNLGLRHNFHGSFDEMNFHDEYFPLKQIEEAGQNVENQYSANYRTSSVMDYTDTFEALAKRPGKYDVAAIKYGYGDLVEVVQRDEAGNVQLNEFGIPLTADKKKAELTAADIAMPYQFCTDGNVNSDPTCNRFDRGVSVNEIVKSLASQYETSYYLGSFRRGNRLFTRSSFRVFTRTILPVRQVLDELFYKLIAGDFEGQTVNDEITPGSFSDYFEALNDGIGLYQEILSAVEPGEYSFDAATNTFTEGAPTSEDAKNVVVQLGVGKYLEAAFTPGGEWEESERIQRRGVEFDKMATMFALTMRGFPALKYQRASLSVNYFAVAKQPILDIFSEFMRDAFKTTMKAVKVPDSEVYLAVANDFEAEEGQEVIEGEVDASTSLSLQINAMIFAMSNYNSNADKTFGDYIAFMTKGVDDSSIPDGIETVEFTSTSGLKTYVVPQTADGNSISFQVAQSAAEMSLKKAQLTEESATLAIDLDAKTDAAFEPVLEALKVVFKEANGAELDEATIESLTTRPKADALDVMMGYIDRVEAFAQSNGDEELLALITAQKETYSELVDGLPEMLIRNTAINRV